MGIFLLGLYYFFRLNYFLHYQFLLTLRILLTCDPEIPVPPNLYGGIERIVYALVNEYMSAGHEVTLLANRDSIVKARLIGWKGERSQNILDTIRNLSTLAKTTITNKFDIIHSFSRLAYLLPCLPLSIPKVMSYQREPSILQISRASSMSRKGSLMFTGCSDYITNQIRAVANAQTIHNCTPVEQFTFSTSVDIDAPLVFLGRIEDIKGTHLAVQVAQKTHRRLIIAGNIPEAKKNYFTEMIQPFLNERIQYVGPVDDNKKNELLKVAAALLMPIQWNEPFGIVMAEAMASGTPVLGFSRGSIPEIITDGVSGYICANLDEMVEYVECVGKIDRGGVRRTAEEKFSNKKIARDYLRLFTEIVDKDK